MFEIKPLEWVHRSALWHRAETPFGTIDVTRLTHKDQWRWGTPSSKSALFSFEHAKAAAEQWYVAKLKEALIEVQPKQG